MQETNSSLISSGIRWVKNLLTSLFLGANICTILLLWISCGSTLISTSSYPILSLLGLAFPGFVLANIGFVLFWIIFKWRYVWVPLLGMLVVSTYILDYYPIHFQQEECPDSTLTILSYNAGGATGDNHEQILDLWKKTQPDLICLQEFAGGWISDDGTKAWMDSMQYQTMQNNGLWIISRLPIVSDSIPIHYPTRSNHSLACLIAYQGDSVLVINNHLESNHIDPGEKESMKTALKYPQKETVEENGRLLKNRLTEAAKFRGDQTDTICALIDRYAEHSMVVCGDFNDTPISYTYQRINSRLKNAYRESGRGIGITYNQKGFFVRIDHIFLSNDWKSYNTYIDNQITASDHYPLITIIGKETK